MSRRFGLLVQRYLVAIAGVVALSITAGCQDVAMQSQEWKQNKIATLYQGYIREFPQVKGIKVQKLQQLQQQGEEVILVDVRSPEEMAVSVIPGAITRQEFEANLEQYKNSTIVAYCTIGYRSGKYADHWRQQGIEVFNLEGSLLAWSHLQGKLVNAQGKTNKVHVFGRQWQLTADDYEPVW